MIILIAFGLALALPFASAPAVRNSDSATTVYIVRHAEKATTPSLDNPDLSPAGEKRAQALADALRSADIRGIYVTDTRRTRQTAAPTAKLADKAVETYHPFRPAELVKQIRQQHSGKATLVVGHSNTLIPLLQEFGIDTSIVIEDHEYDNLFIYTESACGDRRIGSMQRLRYGAPSAP